MWTTGLWVGFDTETTGVDVAADRIVTAALVQRAPGVAETTATWLIDPGVEIPPAAAAVHGITTEHARVHGVAPAAALEEIAQALTAALANGAWLVAFNAAFDLRILRHELTRHGLAPLEERLGGPLRRVLDPLVLDRAVDRWRKGKRTLGVLTQHYQVPVDENLHSADVDVRATLDVLAALVHAHPQVSELSDDELFAWQAAAHRQWAESFNAWRARRQLPGPGADPQWP
ncbi:exonuclease domain-containing protein [Buchananella hordeovulneris]|uniref:DNA polymerase III subunit epsilon n=1 Tax=Buchananella hordeovulneris TaxID=52770 RepID=A0A1Q5PYS7_9ACTO|nr:exonuclease domain-containing protein [Buchananella hordeovulneris]OKL52781.1 DNA polymerase III subunit epsilon [Buchananella hordeovulneris]